MATTTNLYPPILPDTLPAFVRNRRFRIYFSLSQYNSIDDIKFALVSIVEQKTNTSVLSSSFPSGVMTINIQRTKDQRYYIEIDPKNHIKYGTFGLNQFYKIQMRFANKNCADRDSFDEYAGNIKMTRYVSDGWLQANKQYFSEWSQVCLVKSIAQPEVTIHNFTLEPNQQTILPNSLTQIVGNITFKNTNAEDERLRSYNVVLYNAENMNQVLIQTDEIYTNPYAPNEFNYQLQYELLDGEHYVLLFTYTTNNLYSRTLKYNFTIIQVTNVDNLNATIEAQPDQENGRIKIHIVSKQGNSSMFLGNLTIRRTSSKSNFHKWQDVKTVTYKTGTALNYTWYDTTVESGVWYKYCAQKRNASGSRGAIIQIEKPVMCVFDDMFLTRENCQLKIQFNPSLSGFKFNVTESQQTTIGAKYPYVNRNSNNFFRTFTIGGLISSFVDSTSWYDLGPINSFKDSIERIPDPNPDDWQKEIKAFTSKSDIYKDSQTLYNQWNEKHEITQYNDFIYEREFRNKVYDFLYENNVKLFRSTTEGNILVKLMDISFQPVDTLNRYLYSFSATAVEIDEATISNYDKYGIQKTNDYERYVTYAHQVFGQVFGSFSSSSGNLLDTKIKTKYANIYNRQDFKTSVNYLKWLKLEFYGDPYVIIERGGELIKATPSVSFDAADATVGYIVIINGREMVIHPQMERVPDGSLNNDNIKSKIAHLGFFELKGDNVEITDLRFKYPTAVFVNYIAQLTEAEDESGLEDIYYLRNLGQIMGTFSPQDSIMKKLYKKYSLNTKTRYQRLLEVIDVQIESGPNAVVYIKDSKDSDFNRHVLPNGYLKLKDSEALIEGIYFCGIHMTECADPLATETVNGITSTDFELKDGVHNSLDAIEQPENGGIYQVRAYGLKDAFYIQNNRIVVIREESQEHIMVTPDNYYSLILESIEDDETLKFVYYYGCWYLLEQGIEKTSLLKGDIRQTRDTEYILVNEQYNDLSEITHPIKNGVYQISSFIIDDFINYEDTNDLLTVPENSVTTNADRNYELIIKQLFQEAENRYIYYHNNWYPFTANNDVLCPVNGIVNYTYNAEKGNYKQ